MGYRLLGRFLVWAFPPLLALGATAPAPQALQPGEEVLITESEIGRYGGRLVASLHSEPKTLAPISSH